MFDWSEHYARRRSRSGMRLTVEGCYFSRFRFGIFMNGADRSRQTEHVRETDQGIFIAPVGTGKTVTAIVEDSNFEQ
jgi:superfamily II DNA or RNA helicase